MKDTITTCDFCKRDSNTIPDGCEFNTREGTIKLKFYTIFGKDLCERCFEFYEELNRLKILDKD